MAIKRPGQVPEICNIVYNDIIWYIINDIIYIELPVFGLRLKTGGGGWGGALQGVKISEIGAQILRIFFEENESGSSRDAVGHHCREAAKFI